MEETKSHVDITRLVTVQDAAAMLNVSSKAIYYAVAENKLTRHEQFGRVVLDKGEVEAYQPRAGENRPSRRQTTNEKVK